MQPPTTFTCTTVSGLSGILSSGARSTNMDMLQVTGWMVDGPQK